MRKRIQLNEQHLKNVLRNSINAVLCESQNGNAVNELKQKLQYLVTEIQSGRLQDLRQIVAQLHELQLYAEYL